MPPDKERTPGSGNRGLARIHMGGGIEADSSPWQCHCPRCDPYSVTPLYWPQPARTCRTWGAFELIRPLDVIVHYGPLSWTEAELLAELDEAAA